MIVWCAARDAVHADFDLGDDVRSFEHAGHVHGLAAARTADDAHLAVVHLRDVVVLRRLAGVVLGGCRAGLQACVGQSATSASRLRPGATTIVPHNAWFC